MLASLLGVLRPRPIAILAAAVAAGVLFPRLSARADSPAPVYGDDRFGVTLNSDPQQLVTLGVRWFINNSPTTGPLPAGAAWVQYVDINQDVWDQTQLATRAAQHPGSYWLISNEPNVKGSPQELTGAQYAQALHDIAGLLKSADPAARLVAPNIINFDYTCDGCPGYTSGHDWIDGFLASYRSLYGGLPPVDVWGIHTYPLDFEHFPQVNAPLMEDQLKEFRAYLDAVPGLAGAPIWDTEVGTHWGYEGLDWRDDGSGNVKAFPVGAYRTDLVLGYMQELVGWMMTNGPALHIDRWFLFVTYFKGETWEQGYGGINLLDGAGPDAQLTSFGKLYRRLAGLTP